MNWGQQVEKPEVAKISKIKNKRALFSLNCRMYQRNFLPFPKLETERLVLRKLSKEDAAAIFQLRSDQENRKYIDSPLARSLEDAQTFISEIEEGIFQNEFIYWAVDSKNKPNTLLGTICIWNFSTRSNKAEVGFELSQEFQRQGFMMEALTAVLHYAWEELQLTTIEAYTNSQNMPSQRLLKKLDFEKISVFNQEHSTKGYYYSMSVYRLRK